MDQKPYKAYQEIFREDPLLLKLDSQKEYSRHLLSNLLHFRPQKSYRSKAIDFREQASRDGSQRFPEAVPLNIEDAVIEEYRRSTVIREKLNLPTVQINRLRSVTMVSHGEFTSKRNGADIPEDKELTELDFDSSNKRLRIAAIGHRVAISQLKGSGLLEEELCLSPEISGSSFDEFAPDNPLSVLNVESKGWDQLSRTLPIRRDEDSTWSKDIEAKIKLALNKDANIILMPEFSLPPDSLVEGGDVKSMLTELCKKHYEQECMRERGYLIFTGSRHEGPHNRGLIFVQSALNSMRNNSFQPPAWHYKINSAHGLGENILGPGTPWIPSYLYDVKIPGMEYPESFEVFIPICYDVFDSGQFLALAAHCHRNPRRSIVLVPSFNPSSDFVALLRDLSFLGRCIVVYVDSLHGNSEMYVAGYAMSDLTKMGASKLLSEVKGALDKLPEDKNGSSGSPRSSIKSFMSIIEDSSLERSITVEKCDVCSKIKSVPGYRIHKHCCLSDILYYNINIHLATTLIEIRSHLFDESLSELAAPLRETSLARMKESN